jgi:hypothetical protein
LASERVGRPALTIYERWLASLSLTKKTQAREVAGQLTDQEAKQAVLHLAESYETVGASCRQSNRPPPTGVGSEPPGRELVISLARCQSKPQVRAWKEIGEWLKIAAY